MIFFDDDAETYTYECEHIIYNLLHLDKKSCDKALSAETVVSRESLPIKLTKDNDIS